MNLSFIVYGNQTGYSIANITNTTKKSESNQTRAPPTGCVQHNYYYKFLDPSAKEFIQKKFPLRNNVNVTQNSLISTRFSVKVPYFTRQIYFSNNFGGPLAKEMLVQLNLNLIFYSNMAEIYRPRNNITVSRDFRVLLLFCVKRDASEWEILQKNQFCRIVLLLRENTCLHYF